MNDVSSNNGWTDPDDAPSLDEAWFESADLYHGTKLIRRGRPPTGNPKQAVSLRLDQDVIRWFKSTGAGWQTRMNEALRKAAGI
ncbi:MAG: BrnA antitoxin family protein [Sphingopyxis sp.]|nr:BrnA antitoxin family protein [Sphingopyxis sp.]